ncbi:MAG: hypothetical protein AAF298_27555 [Cyanobacteria bacterium P01_A01_bin.40]
MKRKPYPTCGQVLCDLNNDEWELIKPRNVGVTPKQYQKGL